MCCRVYFPQDLPVSMPMTPHSSSVRMNASFALCVCFLMVLFVPCVAWAGGSFEPVWIESFISRNEIDYELVVSPASDPKSRRWVDPYLGRCTTFTVHGTYASVNNFPSFVTRLGHLSALVYLRSSFQEGRTINFGWLGNGFMPVDPKQPCVVRSRALHLWQDRERTAVLSLHDAV